MSVNEDVADLLIDHRMSLLRYEAGVVDDLLTAYRAAFADIAGRVARLEARALAATTPAEVRSVALQLGNLRDRANALSATVRRMEATAGAGLDASMGEVADAEARLHDVRVARKVGVSWAAVPERAVAAALISPIAEGVARAALRRDLLAAAEGIQAAIAEGIAAGSSMPRIARAMRSAGVIEETYRHRLVAIARTETQRVANAVALESYRANADIISGVEWLATLDSRTCLLCAPLHGTVYPMVGGVPMGLVRPPPLHPRCFVGATVVSGPSARGATRRWYAGDVIEVQTESGAIFTVTPNHPMLTTQGWIAASLLHEGGDVLRCLDPKGMAGVLDPDDYQQPSRIDEVARALGSAGGMATTRVPSSPEHFHGDGAGGDVDVVGPVSLLSDHGHAETFQPFREEGFGGRRVDAPRLYGGRMLDLGGKGDGSPPRDGVSSLSVSPILLRGPGRHREAVSLGQAADRYVGVLEPSSGERPARAEVRGAAVLGHPRRVHADEPGGGARAPRVGALSGPDGSRFHSGPPNADDLEVFAKSLVGNVESRGGVPAGLSQNIRADRIVKVFRRRFSGHVYNLETTTGWYIANGIIAHNCRCFTTPVLRPYGELGLRTTRPRKEYDGDPSGGPTFDQWLRRQPQETADDILGPTRAALWRSGTPLDRFSDSRRVLRLGELRTIYDL